MLVVCDKSERKLKKHCDIGMVSEVMIAAWSGDEVLRSIARVAGWIPVVSLKPAWMHGYKVHPSLPQQLSNKAESDWARVPAKQEQPHPSTMLLVLP